MAKMLYKSEQEKAIARCRGIRLIRLIRTSISNYPRINSKMPLFDYFDLDWKKPKEQLKQKSK